MSWEYLINLLIFSNCVVNLSPDKDAVLSQVYRILKSGGEFYFSDVYVNRDIPEEHQELLAGEYIGGAIRWEDLILYATDAGFTQPRLVTAKGVTIINEDIRKAIGNTKFVSAIFRCFKLPMNESELKSFTIPYQLTYETPCPHYEDEFFFDSLFQFKLGELFIVDDPSIAHMLSVSRYKEHFSFDPIDQDKFASAPVVELDDNEQSHENASGDSGHGKRDDTRATGNTCHRTTTDATVTRKDSH